MAATNTYFTFYYVPAVPVRHYSSYTLDKKKEEIYTYEKKKKTNNRAMSKILKRERDTRIHKNNILYRKETNTFFAIFYCIRTDILTN